MDLPEAKGTCVRRSRASHLFFPKRRPSFRWIQQEISNLQFEISSFLLQSRP
jgi:hypothetical protein